MAGKLVTLPSQSEMLERLAKIDNSSHVIEKFHSKLAEYAGQRRCAIGIVMTLQLAIHYYTKNLPPMIAEILNMRMDDYIDAICPDTEIAMEAKELFKAAKLV